MQSSDVHLHQMFLCIQKTGSPRLSVYGVCSSVCSTEAHEDGGRAGAGGGTEEGVEQDGGGGSVGGGGGWGTAEEGETEERSEGDVSGAVFGGRGGGGGGGERTGGDLGITLGAGGLFFVLLSPSPSFSAVLQNLCRSSIGTREASVPTF